VVGPTLKWLAQLRHKADADCMVRNMAQRRILTPGYVVVYPNREKAASKLMKLVVTLILLASVGLMLIITIGGWSKLQGLKPVNIIWSLLYVIIAFYVFFRWSRGLLPIAAALGILLLILAVIAATGVAGTSWFDRNNPGFGAPHTLFGGKGLDPNVLGVLTVILAIVQLAQIVFAMIAFSQAWNVRVLRLPPSAKRKGAGNAGCTSGTGSFAGQMERSTQAGQHRAPTALSKSRFGAPHRGTCSPPIKCAQSPPGTAVRRQCR